jgi:hypothetical protein
MAQRLVYSPKCYAFIKNTREEIMEVTDYVIAGEINRLINQVSTAKITLRNPDRIFTRPGEVAFHPMDPITIFLERTPGHPVQVFTGFLDKVPYYQMRPGPITLEASCTLKKLLYTWYQLAQPYTLSLLEHFGWNPTKGPEGEVIGPTEGGIEGGQGTELADKWAAKAGQEGFQNSPNGVPFGVEKGGQYATNDGSFANLLWAILFFIGDWQDEKIWIENVPASVPKLINKLWNDFEQNDKKAQEEINLFWAAAIGTSSHGKGGGPGGGEGKNQPTGNLTNVKEVVETMTEIAARNNLPPEFVIGTSLSECGFNQSEVTGTNSANATGWFQFTSSEPYPGIKVSYPADARDTAKATESFCKAAVMRAVEKPNLKIEGNWEEWAVQTQQPGKEAYKQDWDTNIAKAKRLVSQYPPTGKKATTENPEETQRNSKETKGKGGGGQRTRIDEMISRASEISNKNYPYSWGGGHPHVGTPSMGPEHSSGGALVNGFDCSGSVLAVLASGGFVPTGSSFGSSGEMGHIYGNIGEPGPGPKGKGITIYWNSQHEWMTINGRYFSTGWNKNPGGGAGWGSEQESEWPETGAYESMHLATSQLEEPYTGEPPPALAGTEGETEGQAKGEEGAGSSTSSILSQATAAAFASNISLPGAIERAEAQIFGGQKALMNSQKLMNFVQQVCQASLRSFQSLPNGDFYAFYPDYFGEFGHHDAYWLIYDIEILDGGIELSDDNLVTHVFSLGNPIYPASPTSNPLVIEQKAGVMTIFEAMDAEGLLFNTEQEEIDQKRPGVSSLMNSQEAVEFLRRYGPRVLKEEYPLVTSTIYECLLAYQQFLLGWSRQFITPFTFTFMPELFPGGKVGFPEHGIQMFIESVTHTWDTTNGYQTVAQLTAPSVLQPNSQTPVVGGQTLPPNMVDALIEPLRDETKKKATAPSQRPALPTKTPNRKVQGNH